MAGRDPENPGQIRVARGRLRLGAALAVAWLCFAACATYDDSLLTTSINSAIPSGGASGGGVPSTDGGSGAGQVLPNAGGSAGAIGGAGVSLGGAELTGSSGAAGAPDAGAAGDDSSSGGSRVSPAGGSKGVAGSSGSTSAAAGSAGSGGGPKLDLIDDFEDTDAFLTINNGRNGAWYAFDDGTAGVENALTIALLPAADARAGSSAALHLTGHGFTKFGAGVGANFLLVDSAMKKVAYDVSAYSGIRFYAKIATGSVASVKVLIPTTYSDPDGGKCVGANCNDHFYQPINGLKTTWDVYECDFKKLVQQGFGLKQTSFDPTSVYSMQFTFATTSLPADVWIDDIYFVLK